MSAPLAPVLDTVAMRDRLVTEAAKRHQVPLSLALAVARVENTRGLPKARSSAGAVGLMQVLPQAHGLAPEQLENPEFNVDFGVRLLKSLYTRHGSWDRALRAYNGALGKQAAGDAYLNRIRTELRRANAAQVR
jgi:soluble lytic murein transglycosylase-like protein